MIEARQLEGRRILIGVTHERLDGTYEQEQFVGTAHVTDQETYCLVTIDCDDGESRDYPFDARTLERAPPGEYRLRSTGVVVKNPDFLMTWIVSRE